MNGLQTANAPSSKIVIPHFIAAAVFFLAAMFLMLAGADSFLQIYYHSHVIAIVHLILLGWGVMMVLGALYQLIPVVYETSLYSEKLAVATFVLFVVSVPLLAYSFWTDSYAGMLFYAAMMMFVSLLMFIVNLHMTYRKSRKKNIQARFITTSVYWLALTEVMGLLIAWNFKYGFLSLSHLHYLKIHAHWGLVGWFLSLIMGAASILIPMFMVSHNQDDKKLYSAYYFTNGGLLLLSVNWLWIHSDVLLYAGMAGIAAGVYFFLKQMYISYRNRLRKDLDTGLQYTRISMIFLIPAVLLGVYAGLVKESFLAHHITLYGMVIVFGFISALILGQTYKTLPFIVWLDLYKPYVGKYKTPMPRELYNDTIVRAQFILYFTGLAGLMTGIAAGSKTVFVFGVTLVIAAVILHLINLIIMITHRIKLEEFSIKKNN